MYEKLGFYGTFSIPAGLIAVDVVLRFAMIEAASEFTLCQCPSPRPVRRPRSNILFGHFSSCVTMLIHSFYSDRTSPR